MNNEPAIDLERIPLSPAAQSLAGMHDHPLLRPGPRLPRGRHMARHRRVVHRAVPRPPRRLTGDRRQGRRTHQRQDRLLRQGGGHRRLRPEADPLLRDRDGHRRQSAALRRRHLPRQVRRLQGQVHAAVGHALQRRHSQRSRHGRHASRRHRPWRSIDPRQSHDRRHRDSQGLRLAQAAQRRHRADRQALPHLRSHMGKDTLRPDRRQPAGQLRPARRRRRTARSFRSPFSVRTSTRSTAPPLCSSPPTAPSRAASREGISATSPRTAATSSPRTMPPSSSSTSTAASPAT